MGLSGTDTERIFADCQAELRKTNFRLIMTEKVNTNWVKRSSRSKKNLLHRAQAEERQRRDQHFLREHSYELFKRFWRCWVSTQWKFPRYQSTSVSHFIQSLEECWAVLENAEPQRMAAKLLGLEWYSRRRFCKSSRVFYSTLSARFHPWISIVSEQFHSSQAVKSENQSPVQDWRCQSGPSAKNSVIPREGDSSKHYGADQRRLQISDFSFDKIPRLATSVCWKIRFKIQVCTCSQFLGEVDI